MYKKIRKGHGRFFVGMALGFFRNTLKNKSVEIYVFMMISIFIIIKGEVEGTSKQSMTPNLKIEKNAILIH